MKHTGITLRARKWRRTSPCPYCGTRKPGIEPYARIVGATMHYIWITTPDDSIKTAIRGWNRYANGEWRKH